MFVVIEGLDGCGKSTQFNLLKEHYGGAVGSDGNDVEFLSFPNYDSEAGALIKSYLSGSYITAPDTSAYSAAAMFALDRYCLLAKRHIIPGTDMLAQRYVTSNIIYQAAKLQAKFQGSFIRWVNDFEYNKLGVPKPDYVMYLQLPVKEAMKRIAYRGVDIHENEDFQYNCERVANKLLANSRAPRWIVIDAMGETGAVNKRLREALDKVGFAKPDTAV